MVLYRSAECWGFAEILKAYIYNRIIWPNLSEYMSTSLISAFVVRCLYSITPLLAKSKF